jgi:hypothetical protein
LALASLMWPVSPLLATKVPFSVPRVKAVLRCVLLALVLGFQ